jgi:hypothetical protein
MYTRRKFLQLTSATGSLAFIPPLLLQKKTTEESIEFLAKFYKSGNFILESALSAWIDSSNRFNLIYQAPSRVIEFDEIKIYKDNIPVKTVHGHLVLFPSDIIAFYWNV